MNVQGGQFDVHLSNGLQQSVRQQTRHHDTRQPAVSPELNRYRLGGAAEYGACTLPNNSHHQTTSAPSQVSELTQFLQRFTARSVSSR